MSLLLDQDGRLPEGLSHLLQDPCSAWHETTGWELIQSRGDGNFGVHNSNLGCLPRLVANGPVTAKHKEGRQRGHFPLHVTVTVHGAVLPSSSGQAEC